MAYRLKMTVGVARIAPQPARGSAALRNSRRLRFNAHRRSITSRSNRFVVSVLLAAGLCTEWWLARQAS